MKTDKAKRNTICVGLHLAQTQDEVISKSSPNLQILVKVVQTYRSKANLVHTTRFWKKSLKIPKGQSESVYRGRTDNTMAKRKSIKVQKDK
jgi:hypothetical protein